MARAAQRRDRASPPTSHAAKRGKDTLVKPNKEIQSFKIINRRIIVHSCWVHSRRQVGKQEIYGNEDRRDHSCGGLLVRFHSSLSSVLRVRLRFLAEASNLPSNGSSRERTNRSVLGKVGSRLAPFQFAVPARGSVGSMSFL